MKKTLRMMGLCALIALAAVGCKKEQQTTSSFKATLTQPTSNAKTHIGDSDSLLWNAGDAIKVFDGAGNAYLFTTDDDNKSTATFSGEATINTSNTYTAFYPAANTSDVTNGEILLTLAAEQTYVAGGFANGTFPIAAVNDGAIFTFHSRCGLLAIPVKGSGNVGSIVLTSKTTTDMLAGQLRYDLSGNYLGLTNGQASVTLNCGGLPLDATNATTFYFALPAGVFANGFTVSITNGTTEIYHLETTKPNVIAAETILMMPELPVASVGVTTNDATSVLYTTATINGGYTASLGLSIDEVGFYYGMGADLSNQVTTTLANPFSYDLTGLTEGTTYSFKAYAKNGTTEYTGNVETFTTGVSFVAPMVTTGTAAATSATTGTGHVTLTNAGTGPVTQVGICWSTSDNPEVSPTAANFALATGQNVNTEYALDITGLAASTQYYVRGFAKVGDQYYYGSSVNFTTPEPSAPNGALPNGFSVSPTQRVWFSQGNLRATAAAANNSDPSNWTWSFAEHQWDYIGNATANTSVNGNGTVSTPGTVDLFCWSTDWSYYGIRNDAGQTNTHLYIGDFIDWGNNTITNGTNPVNPWRTLTNDEWSYLLNGRDDHESKYSVGKIDDIVGFVILPDTWVLPENCTFQPGKRPNGQWHWEDNPYQTTDPTADNYWPKMEAAGAAFLPATGDRYGASVTIWSYDNRVNGYWSSTPNSEDDRLAYYFGFNVSDYLGLYSLAFAQSYRYVGMCVRLVQNIE